MMPDEIRLTLEGEAAFGLHGFQPGQIGEALVSERLVGERPEMLGGLELGGVGGQGEEMDALWNEAKAAERS